MSIFYARCSLVISVLAKRPSCIRAFVCLFFFFSSRRRHTRYWRDWSSDVCSSDLATTVQTRASDAFALKRGVCQDFSHIMIAGLRGLGIPAGYVSGFLRTIPPKGKPRLEGADAMHAWVKAWCGRDAGWQEFDPTNGIRASNDHITVGYGRDYSDVAP